MNDPVADVLIERSRMEGGAAAAVAFSIFAHAGISALAVWAALHQPRTQVPAVMNIRFAQPKAVATATPEPVAKAPEPAPVPAPLVKPAAPEPKPFAVPAKPAAKPVEASPFGKSNKKETAAPAVKPVEAGPAATGAVTTTQPDVAIEGGDFPYTVYIDRMKTLIGTHWFRPVNGTATIQFTIDRDGTIRDVKTDASSGSGAFDRAALRAVLESSPLPPLPFGYSGTYLVVHLTFR
jgi:TonB family protein